METYNTIINTLEDIEEQIELIKIKEEDDWDNNSLDTALECIEEAKGIMIDARDERDV